TTSTTDGVTVARPRLTVQEQARRHCSRRQVGLLRTLQSPASRRTANQRNGRVGSWRAPLSAASAALPLLRIPHGYSPEQGVLATRGRARDFMDVGGVGRPLATSPRASRAHACTAQKLPRCGHEEPRPWFSDENDDGALPCLADTPTPNGLDATG